MGISLFLPLSNIYYSEGGNPFLGRGRRSKDPEKATNTRVPADRSNMHKCSGEWVTQWVTVHSMCYKKISCHFLYGKYIWNGSLTHQWLMHLANNAVYYKTKIKYFACIAMIKTSASAFYNQHLFGFYQDTVRWNRQ